MFPDRSLQLKILEELKSCYPEQVPVEILSCYSDDRDFMANLFYLHDLKMIDGDQIREYGTPRTLFTAIITWQGIDFLEGDGGLAPFRTGADDITG